MTKIKWDAPFGWQLRWLFSSQYRRERRLAMDRARTLAQDAEHIEEVSTMIKTMRINPPSICHHPDHLDALFTAVACPGCGRQ